MTRPILYICAPYKTATEIEKSMRIQAILRAIELGWCPVFAPFLFERAMPEESDQQREILLECDSSIIEASFAMLVIGERRTSGMLIDLRNWLEKRSSTAAPIFNWPTLPPASQATLSVEAGRQALRP